MRRLVSSFLPLLGFGSLLLSATGCFIVSDPGPRQPARAQPAPPATAVVRPVTPVAPATAVAPPAVVPAHDPGPQGPHVTVDGKDYITLRSPIVFGSSDNGAGSFRGYVYFLPTNTTSLPNFDSLTPSGVLFTRAFDAAQSPYAQGLPGIDQGRNSYFGIRYDGVFTTAVVGEYTFRLESDDGARLSIDSAPVANIDGAHPDKSGRGVLKLAPGPHNFRLEYFQAGGAVVLKVMVTPPGATAERSFAAAF